MLVLLHALQYRPFLEQSIESVYKKIKKVFRLITATSAFCREPFLLLNETDFQHKP